MKPLVVIGLGNPLMGDDGVGARVAHLLAEDGEVTGRADVLSGGTDLLRYQDQMEGRRQVILIDAEVSACEPGQVRLVEESPRENRPESGHTLSAAQALELMRRVTPSLEGTRFTWVLVSVRGAHPGTDLSPEVAAAVRRAAEAVRRVLQRQA